MPRSEPLGPGSQRKAVAAEFEVKRTNFGDWVIGGCGGEIACGEGHVAGIKGLPPHLPL